jgi:cysteine-rich repeat protein
VDVSGRWRLVTTLVGTMDFTFVQSGTSLRVDGALGPIDPATGVFDAVSSGADCAYFRIQGTATDASMSGIIEGGARRGPPSFDCVVVRGEFTGTRNPSCGNSITEPGEACDDGNLDWADCCNPLCVQIPAGWPCADDGLACTSDRCDAAGACQHPLRAAGEVCRASTDACDVTERCDGAASTCPADVAPDADGDGLPDVCDGCPTGRPLVAARLKAGRYDGVAGNDALTVSGRTTLDAGAVLDPVAHGIVIAVTGAGADAFTAIVPAGTVDPATGQGWKASPNGTAWTFRGNDPALLVTKVTVKRSGNVVSVKAVGRRRTFATALPAAPVRLAIALDPPPATSATCGEATFQDAGAPAPHCTVQQAAGVLVCK